MIKKFLTGTAMAAVLLAGILATLLVAILSVIYAAEAFGPLAAAGAMFASMCVIAGVLHVVFD